MLQVQNQLLISGIKRLYTLLVKNELLPGAPKHCDSIANEVSFHSIHELPDASTTLIENNDSDGGNPWANLIPDTASTVTEDGRTRTGSSWPSWEQVREEALQCDSEAECMKHHDDNEILHHPAQAGEGLHLFYRQAIQFPFSLYQDSIWSDRPKDTPCDPPSVPYPTLSRDPFFGFMPVDPQ
jgi:hypothetical protein